MTPNGKDAMTKRKTTVDRIRTFLKAHPDQHYTPKQVAHYLHITERTALHHLERLLAADLIHEETR